MVILFATSWWHKPLVVLAQLYHQIWKYWPVLNVKYQSDNQTEAPQQFFLGSDDDFAGPPIHYPNDDTGTQKKRVYRYGNISVFFYSNEAHKSIAIW